MVAPTGLKSWRWKYRFAGKEGLKVLGRFPEVGLRDARAMRDAADKARRAGVDPARAGTPVTSETFEGVAKRWHNHQAKRWRPKHAATVLRTLEQYAFPHIGKKMIGDIRAPAVPALLRRVEARGAND